MFKRDRPLWWLIPRRRGLLGRLMVNSCTLGGCRVRFLMCTPCCTLDRRRSGMRMAGMLLALSASCVFPWGSKSLIMMVLTVLGIIPTPPTPRISVPVYITKVEQNVKVITERKQMVFLATIQILPLSFMAYLRAQFSVPFCFYTTHNLSLIHIWRCRRIT